MGASAPPQGEAGGGLQALQEEVDTLLRQTIQCYGHEWTDSAEPLLGLWSRLSQYQSVCDHIVAWTSCTPAMPRTPDFPPLRPSPKAITAGTAELPARLQNAWVAALPVDRLQRARGIVSEMSSVIRRQLWSLEQAMFDSLRVIHDLSTEQQLEEFQTLDTAITGAAEWHPALHWYGSDRRVQCLRGLRFLQVAPRAHEYDPVDWESALPGDEPRRKRAARYLASLRRAISPEVVELVESMQQKHRAFLPACSYQQLPTHDPDEDARRRVTGGGSLIARPPWFPSLLRDASRASSCGLAFYVSSSYQLSSHGGGRQGDRTHGVASAGEGASINRPEHGAGAAWHHAHDTMWAERDQG